MNRTIGDGMKWDTGPSIGAMILGADADDENSLERCGPIKMYACEDR